MVDKKTEPEEFRPGWQILLHVIKEMRGHRMNLTVIAVLGAIIAPLAILQPLAMKITVDNYFGDEALPAVVESFLPSSLLALDDRLGYLLIAASLILFVAVVGQALAFTRRVLRVVTKERMVLSFRTRLFGHVERLSLAYHDEKGPSESTFRILMDTAVIPAILIDGLIPTLQSLILLVVIASMILSMSPTLALVALAIAPLLLAVSWPFGRRLRKHWHEIKSIETTVLGRLQEVFAAMRVIKAFGREEGETDRLMKLAEKGVIAKIKVAKVQGVFTVLTKLIAASGTAGFLIIGGQMVKSGSLSLGDLVLIAALMVQFYSPLQQVIGQVATLQSSLASADRVLGLLDKAPEVVDRPDAMPLTRARGKIEFRDVTFEYEPERKVIDQMSFLIHAGRRIGVAGHTGAGKTTIMNLITRLYDPSAGSILLDDTDIRDIKLDDLRQQFSIVLQEPVLFKKSVEENIRYARPEATLEEVYAAARQADAHDFICAMPEGYDTIVGDRGQRLSGGERQRISLARAFLKDAPILILDEPTSSVDMKTEESIMNAFDELMQGRTTFIIAHRPSTLERCDEVLVIEHGQVVTLASPDSVDSLDELMMSSNKQKTKETGVA